MPSASPQDGGASVQGVGSTGAVGTPQIRIKSNLSVHHLRAAVFFAKRAGSLEAVTLPVPETVQSEHRSYVLGAITTAAAFLEAFVNELYLSAVDCATDKSSYTTFGLAQTKAEGLASEWLNQQKQKTGTLPKYQRVLELLDTPVFADKDLPYQRARLLIALRNALMHYKPEWSDELEAHLELEQQLAGQFAVNRLAAADEAFFPHRCLGAGCAEWAWDTADAFARAFMTRLGLAYRLVMTQALISTGDDAVVNEVPALSSSPSAERQARAAQVDGGRPR